MEQQAINGLKRALLNVLVRAVHRVARLEGNNALPPLLDEERPRRAMTRQPMGEAIETELLATP